MEAGAWLDQEGVKAMSALIDVSLCEMALSDGRVMASTQDALTTSHHRATPGKPLLVGLWLPT